MTPRILLHVMTVLTKLMCALSHVCFIKVGLTDIKQDDSEDTPCDIRKKTCFRHFKRGSKRVDTIPVTSVINKSKYLTISKAHEDGVHAGVRYSGDQCNY